jgi:hypothetical protein
MLLPVVVLMTATGCALVPTDFMPRPVFVWSREYKDYRQEKRNEEHYSRTNLLAP